MACLFKFTTTNLLHNPKRNEKSTQSKAIPADCITKEKKRVRRNQHSSRAQPEKKEEEHVENNTSNFLHNPQRAHPEEPYHEATSTALDCTPLDYTELD